MRKLSLLLVLAVLLAVPVAAYSDVADDHWAASAIEEMTALHVTTGYPDDTFRPGDTLSRAQFLSMVVRICTDESVPLAEEGEDWWQPYVDTATDLGILSDDIFPADADFLAPVSRQEMALLLLGADVCLGLFDDSVVNAATLPTFPDVPAEQAQSVAMAAATGLLTGYHDGTFRPNKTTTRAEACVVLQRLLRHKELLEADEILVCADGKYLIKYAQPENGVCTLTSLRLSDGKVVDTAEVPRETYTDADGKTVRDAASPMLGSAGDLFWGYSGLWEVGFAGHFVHWTTQPVIDCAPLPDGSVAAILCDKGARPVTLSGDPCGVRVAQVYQSSVIVPLTDGDTANLTAVETVNGQIFLMADGIRCQLEAGRLTPA